MASLTAGLKLGTGSVSGLIRNAQSLQTSISNAQDAAAKNAWTNSGYDDTSFQEYTNYLNGRISTLHTAGTVAGLSKAQSMQQELITAAHSNISYQISQENNRLMMAGDAGTSSGYEQKMGVVADQYNRALSIGDMTLANSLQSQYLSLDQSRQAAVQSEASAADALYKSNVAAAKANNSAISQGFTDAKQAIHDSVQNLFANIRSGDTSKNGKPGDVNSQLTEYVKNWGPAYKALTGQDLPKGKQLTMGSLVEASFTAKLNYDMNAAKALGGSDPTAAAKFAQFDANGAVIGGDAMKILNNTDFYSVPGHGNMNMKDAMNWAAVPNLYRTETKDGQTIFAKNAITGYKMINGQPMEVSNGEDKLPALNKTGVLGNIEGKAGMLTSQKMTGLLVKAGFGDVKYNKDGTFTTKLTAQSDHWLQAHGAQADLASGNGQVGAGNEITWRRNNQGGFDAITSGNRLVHLAFDPNGRAGVFQTLSNGQTTHLSGQYGFNQHYNTFTGNAGMETLRARMGQEQFHQLNMKAAANIANISSPKPMPGSFNALHPQAGGAQPSHFIGPNINMAQRAGGGFNFTQNGQSISAARYAQLSGTPFRTLLSTMAAKGDSGARSALGFVGNDFGYDPGKIGGNSGVYNALTWGVHPAAGGGGSSAAPKAPSGANGSLSIGGLGIK